MICFSYRKTIAKIDDLSDFSKLNQIMTYLISQNENQLIKYHILNKLLSNLKIKEIFKIGENKFEVSETIFSLL